MNGLGTPKVAYAQAQRIYTPGDLTMNGAGISFTNAAIIEYPGVGVAGIDVSGYGMWSIFVSVSTAVNTSMYLIVRDELDLTNLVSLLVSGTIAGVGTVYHFTFGTPGTTVAVVPARTIKFGMISSAPGNVFVTCRIFGRGF